MRRGAGARARALRHIRAAVLLSGDWPALGALYRGVYSASIARAARALDGGDDWQLWLRGSAASHLRPGLSDIDLVLLPKACSSMDLEAQLCQRFARRVAQLNRPLPLFRDVHVLFPDELSALCAVGAALPHVLAEGGRCLAGVPSLPPMPGDATAERALLVREVLYWARRAGSHLASGEDSVDQQLAGRALDKAHDAVELLQSHCTLPQGARASSRSTASSTGSSTEANWSRFADLLRSIDVAFANQPDAATGTLHPSPAPSSAASTGAAGGEHSAFVDAALRLPSVQSVLLARDGSSRVDNRTYVVVDAAHAELPADLRALALLGRRSPHGPSSARAYAAPWVTTAPQLERSVCMPLSVFESLERATRATLLGAPLGSARATDAQIARAAVEKMVNLACRTRESRPHGPDLREQAMLEDGLGAFIPDVVRLLELGSSEVDAAARAGSRATSWTQRAAELRRLELLLLPELVRLATRHAVDGV